MQIYDSNTAAVIFATFTVIYVCAQILSVNRKGCKARNG